MGILDNGNACKEQVESQWESPEMKRSIWVLMLTF